MVHLGPLEPLQILIVKQEVKAVISVTLLILQRNKLTPAPSVLAAFLAVARADHLPMNGSSASAGSRSIDAAAGACALFGRCEELALSSGKGTSNYRVCSFEVKRKPWATSGLSIKYVCASLPTHLTVPHACLIRFVQAQPVGHAG